MMQRLDPLRNLELSTERYKANVCPSRVHLIFQGITLQRGVGSLAKASSAMKSASMSRRSRSVSMMTKML
ncbi:hypothetical protein FGO68_gene12848 [Halteria grandinella]|uniref:Uncharacterized protein n=1 Tax=Halteria grandinella TaxID=5974 RepID=A0A8J8SVP6_HALGN|nr:hypothetical protein FGO68_gene12848 [Halteria grandinella]